MRLLLTLTAFSVCAFGCATTPQAAFSAPNPPAANAKLYQRLGGQPAIEAVIDDFMGRLAKDERINATFAGSHVPRLRKRLVELVCYATGGPCTYSGRDMKTVHTGMNITHAQFDIVVGHLVATLDAFKVPATEKGELLALLGPMRGDIVEAP
ncbi:MAG: group 1 truncated hemoglobin [Myxococcaceae bacterium]|nr:group 1 truncated hemoglobin [Myxococcaceae bacterium]